MEITHTYRILLIFIFLQGCAAGPLRDGNDNGELQSLSNLPSLDQEVIKRHSIDVLSIRMR